MIRSNASKGGLPHGGRRIGKGSCASALEAVLNLTLQDIVVQNQYQCRAGYNIDVPSDHAELPHVSCSLTTDQVIRR